MNRIWFPLISDDFSTTSFLVYSSWIDQIYALLQWCYLIMLSLSSQSMRCFAYCYHCLCEQATGTRFTKYSTRMLPESSEHRERLVYERVNYGCIHSGKTKQRDSTYIGVRSQKIGCQARIRACIAKDKLKVMLYSMKHNHIVSNAYWSSGSTRKPFPVSSGFLVRNQFNFNIDK